MLEASAHPSGIPINGAVSLILPYSGLFSRGVYFTDFVEIRAQFANFEIMNINSFKVGVV
jgi:hypothetical protein